MITIQRGLVVVAAGIVGTLGLWGWRHWGANEQHAAATDHAERALPPGKEMRSQRVPDAASIELPAPERAYIWQIEHFVIVLDFRFWPVLSAAIREENRDKLLSFFAPEAHTELIDEQQVRSEPLPYARFRVAAPPAAAPRSASVGDLADHLLTIVRQLDSDRRVSIKTVFLSPQDRGHLDGPWHGRLVVRIWGQSKSKQPTEHVIEADFQLATLNDEVPTPAPWLASCKIVQESFRQTDLFLLPEVGKSWGFDRTMFHDNSEQPGKFPRIVTGGIYLSDYDLDGRVDALIVDSKRTVLYHQIAPGKFVDDTLAAGLDDLPQGVVAATFADLDNDAYPDLIAGNWIYHNTSRGTFRHAAVLGSTADSAIGFAIADYDRDGLLDIYITRGAPGPSQTGGKSSWLDDRTGPGNSLMHNLGNWKFADVTSASNASAGNLSCFAAAWLDVDGDMWPDIFASDEFGSPVLLVNRTDGTFESRAVTGSFGGFCMGVAAGDLDDDGQTDLYLANMYSKAGERVLSNLDLNLYPPEIAARIKHIVDGSELWRNRGNLEFESHGRAAGVARVGWAYGPCLADLDNDGRLDIYAPAGFYSVSRDEPDG